MICNLQIILSQTKTTIASFDTVIISPHIQTTDHIKLTAFGEASLYYEGNLTIKKGITIGGVEISQIN